MSSAIAARIKTLYPRDLGSPVGKAAPFKNSSRTRTAVRLALAALLGFELTIIHYLDKFTALRQGVFLEGSRLETEYRRRTSLVPFLAEVSAGYARHERGLMSFIADARTLKEYSLKLGGAAGPEMSARIDKVVSKVSALAEQYPDLKADRSYQALMRKTALSENRVAAARREYIYLINNYNREVMLFPGSLFARLLKFPTFHAYAPEKEPGPEKNTRFFFIY
ncbi:MAG: LemA family protein [Elusimicrobiota bacterium]|nr:LemA family protein [Elusimicrobiota bacterium]